MHIAASHLTHYVKQFLDSSLPRLGRMKCTGFLAYMIAWFYPSYLWVHLKRKGY